MRLLPTPPTDTQGLRRSWRIRGAVAIAALSLLAAGVAASHAGGALIVSRPVDRPDAIIVLGSHESERLPRAVTLADQYRSAEVWLTVPVRVTRHNCEHCAERVDWLVQAGVDPRRIRLLPDRVENTHDEAQAAAVFAGQHPIDRLVVVTSPYHARRALATFRHLFESAKVGTEIGIVTPAPQAHATGWWRRKYDRDYVAYEWAAIIYYGVRYGVFAVRLVSEKSSQGETRVRREAPLAGCLAEGAKTGVFQGAPLARPLRKLLRSRI